MTKPTKGRKMTEKIEITNSTVLGGLDAMLTAATGGKVFDFKEFADKFNNSAEKIGKLSDQLKAANAKLAKASVSAIPTTGKDIVNAEELTYEVNIVPASDVFEPYFPKKTKSFSFSIPTLVWKDTTAKIVKHPEVPEIDENYQFDMINTLKFLTAFSKNANVYAHGHTGTGKSTFVEQIAALIGFPVSRVNLDSNLERADLVGHIALREKGGATVSAYEEGVLPRAMQRPGFLLLDEIDAGRPDILFVIQRALEGSGLMLTEDHGRIIKAHPLFRFTATANTRGQGDEFGIYQGTRNLNTSLIDRFPVFIEFKYLAKDVEHKLLKSKFPDLGDKDAEMIIAFGNEMRHAFSNGELFQPVTPRGLQSLSEMYLHFDAAEIKNPMGLALEMTILDKTTRDTVQKVKEIMDRCIKIEKKKAA